MAKNSSMKKRSWWGFGLLGAVVATFAGGVFAARKLIVAAAGTWAPIFADSPDAKVVIATAPIDPTFTTGALGSFDGAPPKPGDLLQVVLEAKGSNDTALVVLTVTSDTPPTGVDPYSAVVAAYTSTVKTTNKGQPPPAVGEKYTVLAQHIHAIKRK